MNKIQLVATCALLAAFTGCTTAPQFQSGPDAEVTHDGLTKVDNTALDAVWARTDIDASEYTKVLFDGVGIEFRPVTGAYSGRAGTSQSQMRRAGQSEFQLDEKTKALVKEEITSAFVEELQRSKVFEVVDQPGPDVLTVRAGLLDVISRVPPDTVGRSTILIDRVGEATLVLELHDSMSDAILARAIDRRAAERGTGSSLTISSPALNRAEVRRLGREWARTVRSGLETLMTQE